MNRRAVEEKIIKLLSLIINLANFDGDRNRSSERDTNLRTYGLLDRRDRQWARGSVIVALDRATIERGSRKNGRRRADRT